MDGSSHILQISSNREAARKSYSRIWVNFIRIFSFIIGSFYRGFSPRGGDNYCYNIKEELRSSQGKTSASDRFNNLNLFRRTSNNPIQERKEAHNTSNTKTASNSTRFRPKSKIETVTEKESHKSENCEPRKNNFMLKTLNVSQSANDNDDSECEETPLNPSNNPPSKTKPKSGLWMKVSKNLDSPVLKRKNEVNDINVRLIILNN